MSAHDQKELATKCQIMPSRSMQIHIPGAQAVLGSWTYICSFLASSPSNCPDHSLPTTMTSHKRDYAPLAATHGQATPTHVSPSDYELFWRRAPVIVYPNCLLILFCSFYGWPWLGMTLGAISTLVLLGVALTECLGFDRRLDTPRNNVHPYINTKESF